MKQYRTKILKSVAILLFSFPLVYITWAAALFDIPINTCFKILLSPTFFIVSISALFSGYGLWEMRRWSWYLFLMTQFLILYESTSLILYFSESHHKLLVYLISIFTIGLLTYRVSKDIRVPYFFPKIRWWESNPRYRFSIPVTLTRKSGEIQVAEILDLSMTGCFVKLRNDLIQDENLSLKFRAFGYEIQSHGTAVWLAQTAVTHPKGIGIKFGLISKSQKRLLRALCRKLRKISSFYKRSRYLMSQEEFLKKLEEIELQGIDPKVNSYNYK